MSKIETTNDMENHTTTRHEAAPDKVIPILPCADIRRQAAFYQILGFELLGLYASPNPYAALQWRSIEIHFYGSRKVIPAENPSMCFIKVRDVDAVYNSFASHLKQHSGKIPRTGIPKITKVRDLSNDRRFTLTDPGGNTVFVGCPIDASANFFRRLQSEQFAQAFAVLYDVVYSKEDHALAAKMLRRYHNVKELLLPLDKAKFLLVILEIQKHVGQPLDDLELRMLIEAHENSDDDWRKIEGRYREVIEEA